MRFGLQQACKEQPTLHAVCSESERLAHVGSGNAELHLVEKSGAPAGCQREQLGELCSPLQPWERALAWTLFCLHTGGRLQKTKANTLAGLLRTFSRAVYCKHALDQNTLRRTLGSCHRNMVALGQGSEPSLCWEVWGSGEALDPLSEEGFKMHKIKYIGIQRKQIY